MKKNLHSKLKHIGQHYYYIFDKRIVQDIFLSSVGQCNWELLCLEWRNNFSPNPKHTKTNLSTLRVRKKDGYLKKLWQLPIHNKSNNILLGHIGKLSSKDILQSYQPMEQNK
jgi:hypothetical protein